MNLGDRRQRPYTWHKGIMEPYPNYEHGMVCPSCGLQRSRDVAHNCVNELRIELNKIKKEKQQIQKQYQEIEGLARQNNQKISQMSQAIRDFKEHTKLLNSRCKMLEKLIQERPIPEELKLDRALYSEPQLSHQSISVEEEPPRRVQQPPRHIDLAQYKKNKKRKEEEEKKEERKEEKKSQTRGHDASFDQIERLGRTYLEGKEEQTQRKLFVYEDLLFEGVDQIKYPEEDEDKKLIELEDQQEEGIENEPDRSRQSRVVQKTEKTKKIGQGFIEMRDSSNSSSGLNLDKKEELKREEEKEEVKFQEPYQEEEKQLPQPSNFFKFDEFIQDYELPATEQEEKSNEKQRKFKLDSIFQQAEVYQPVEQHEALQVKESMKLREYLQKYCSGDKILQYSFGMTQNLVEEVMIHLEKLTKSINDSKYNLIGQHLNFMMITPKNKEDQRFSLRELKAILEEECDCLGFLNLNQREAGFYLATTEKKKKIKRAFGEAAECYHIKSEVIDVDVLTLYWNQDDRTQMIRIPQSFEIRAE